MRHYSYETYSDLAKKELFNQYYLIDRLRTLSSNLSFLKRLEQDVQNDYNNCLNELKCYRDLYSQTISLADSLSSVRSMVFSLRIQRYFDKANVYKLRISKCRDLKKELEEKLWQIGCEVKSTQHQIDVYSASLNKSKIDYYQFRKRGKKSQLI